MKKKIFLVVFFYIIVAISFRPETTIAEQSVTETVYEEGESEPIEEVEVPITEISISAVGDIMVHGPQLRAQYDKKNNIYDFKNNFEFIKPYIEGSDLAICNLETTFAGNERKYSSYPRFNTPDSLAEAIKYTGFDVVCTANNHTMDTGKSGVLRTIKVLKDTGFNVVGTKENKEDLNFIIKEVKGVKIGITAYTYETVRRKNNKTLNGLLVPKEIEDQINTFNYNNIDQDLEKMKKDIENMKEQGAEIIVFYVHWGNEYKRNPNEHQKRIAQSLANFGVDVIFGSHPHVLQPIEFIKNENNEKETLVVYSMGNILSNQRYETLKNRYTEDGIIVNVNFAKDFYKNEITLKEVTYIPTWVHKYLKNGRRIYEIIPLNENLEDETKSYGKNKNSQWRVKNSKENTIQLVEPVLKDRISITASKEYSYDN